MVTADGEVLRTPTSSPAAAAPRLAGAPPPMPAPVPSQMLSAAREMETFPSVAAPPGAAPTPAAPSSLVSSSLASSELSAARSLPADAPRFEPTPPTSLSTSSEPLPAEPASITRRVEPPSSREHPLLGVQLDVGFPDGVGASFMVMPADWLRLQVGGSWNGASRGVRFGLVALLFPSFFKSVRPTVSLESGYAFDTDSQWLVSMVQDDALKAALSKVSVLHGGGHLGLEFGSKYFSFFLRGGVSYVDVQLASYEGESATARGLALHGLFPSGKLGFVICFL